MPGHAGPGNPPPWRRWSVFAALRRPRHVYFEGSGGIPPPNPPTARHAAHPGQPARLAVCRRTRPACLAWDPVRRVMVWVPLSRFPRRRATGAPWKDDGGKRPFGGGWPSLSGTHLFWGRGHRKSPRRPHIQKDIGTAGALYGSFSGPV